MTRYLAPLAAAGSVALVAVSASGASSSELTGHVWVLTSLSRNAPVAGTSPTMAFTSSKVSGTTGCNSYSAGYTSGLRTLRVDEPVAVTRKACAPAISGQETKFLAMLEKVRRYSVRRDTLTLRGTAGNELATFKLQTQQLAGTSWRVTAYNNGKQAVASVDAGTRLTATFSSDSLSGSGGCNSYDAPYEASPPKVTIGPVAATEKNCPSPSGVMAQEAAYFVALGTARTYRIEGATLELRTQTGALAVELTKS